MISLLKFLSRHAMAAMAAGVFIGLLAPPLAKLLAPLLAPSVWALLVISLLRTEGAAAMAHLRRPGRVAGLLVWCLAATPAITWGLVSLTGLPGGLAAAMVLAAGSSPLISTPALGILLGLDGAFILTLLIPATLLIPLTLPGIALALLGFEVDVSAGELMVRLAALVGTSMLAAWALRRGLGAQRVRAVGAELDGASVLILIVFAIAIMDGLTARLLAEPGYVLFVTALTFAAYAGLMALTVLGLAIIQPQWGRRLILSAGFTAGCRNLAVILAVLPAGADPDLFLYFAVGQFPIYLMPAILKPLVLRLLKNETISRRGFDE